MSRGQETIVVVDYDPAWAEQFEVLRSHLSPVVGHLALSIEHVGSTSVVGLAAKPILDVDILVDSAAVVPLLIERLRGLGYEHLGILGVEGREAFRPPAGSVAHNLYVCLQGGLG